MTLFGDKFKPKYVTEINLVGGILEDSETRSLSGYPWLLKIPILNYLFGQENKDLRENEIVFAITPHIVRSEEITDENLKLIDIGTGGTIGLRYKEPKPAKANTSTPSSETPSAKNRARQSSEGPAQANPPAPPPLAGPPLAKVVP